MLQHNADPNATDFNGETAFHTAAEYNQIEIGQLLKRNNARNRCKPYCAQCRNFNELLSKQSNQHRSAAMKLRRKREIEEQKQKDEEERI